MKTTNLIFVFALIIIYSSFTMSKINMKQDFSSRISALESSLAKLNSQLSAIEEARGSSSDSSSQIKHMYTSNRIYHDIFQAMQSNIIVKKGNPIGWNDKSHVSNLYEGRKGLNIGNGIQQGDNGIQVNIPDDGSDLLWIRVFNNRWSTFRIKSLGSKENPIFEDWIEIYACGWRGSIETNPDGSAPDSRNRVHHWCPIPIRSIGTGRKYMIYTDKNGEGWISGIAFGKNNYNHAKNSAVAYHWNLNGGSEVLWSTHDWYGDQLANIQARKINELYVPVIPNGKDKLLYFVERNHGDLGVAHGDIRVNGRVIERFRTTYNNIFANHYGSKLYNRYFAARIPAELIQADDEFVRVEINLVDQNESIYFREMGTHDFI